MKAIIIAGGLGTRMRPLTDNLPKPIIPIANRPFLVHQIDQLVRHGIDEVIVNLHYLSEEIKKVLDNGNRWGIKINYSIEESPLGTAGAVKNAEEFFGREPMLICNGDILTNLDITKLVEYHREKKAKVALALTEVEDPTAFGLVLMDENNRVTRFWEKPTREEVAHLSRFAINAGTYVVDPAIFNEVPKGQKFMFEHDLYPLLLKQGVPIFGYLSEAYWLDVGNPQKYFEAHVAIMRHDVAVTIQGERVMGGVWLGRGTRPDSQARLWGPAVVGDIVTIGKGTEIKEYVVIGHRCSIGDNCRLERTILWADCQIGDRAQLVDCILGKGCVVEDDVIMKPGSVLGDGTVVRKDSQ